MIYVSDLGNEIFPGRINGGCYTFRKKEAKIEQYCLNFREYVTEISQIFPYSQIDIKNALIIVIDAFHMKTMRKH